jgi:NDP-sugar pyrophosphorylase family protein
MIAIIPLAGKSERFAKAGYEQPKWALPVSENISMLRAVLFSIGDTSRTIMIAHASNAPLIRLILPVSSESLNQFVYEFMTETSGPMETILRVKESLKTDDELLINYCDCFAANGLSDFLAAMRSSGEDAGAYCFRSNNPRFQYDPTGQYALGGIFWFRHADEFLRRARKMEVRPDLSPAHIAFTYRGVAGLDGYRLYVDTKNYVDLGTPEDYERHCGKPQKAQAVDAKGLPVFASYEEFMASDLLGQWRKDDIGYILYRSVTKQPVTDAEMRLLAQDMGRSLVQGGRQ